VYFRTFSVTTPQRRTWMFLSEIFVSPLAFSVAECYLSAARLQPLPNLLGSLRGKCRRPIFVSPPRRLQAEQQELSRWPRETRGPGTFSNRLPVTRLLDRPQP